MTDIRETLTAAMEEIWNDDLTFEGQADAVLALVGPKPLDWRMPYGTVKAEFGGGTIRIEDFRDYFMVEFSTPGHSRPLVAGSFADLSSAQAAAQAHADAAHWRNTPLGDLIGKEPK